MLHLPGLILAAALSAMPSPYAINDRVAIKTADGSTISAIIVRRRSLKGRQPAALRFTIYADPQKDIERAEYGADRGYVDVTAYTRGKGYSPQQPVPYEYDGRDAVAVIDWIAKQPWSNGKVGMYSGSYEGFTQWAAAKYMPPALKTIVPYVANNPGNGLPMQNNVFLPVNYAWIYYVTDNKFLDDATYNSPRWRGLFFRWYNSGRAYRDIDKVAGVPNPWLHKWLQHPSFDAYWQAMVPYREDFARINIPVLTFTGYYDDGQISALAFYRDHAQFNPHAKHYVIIGPWDHFGTQRHEKTTPLRGYAIDPVAHVDTPKITFDWFDYIMRGGPKPALLRGRINYQVMGANVWRHADSLNTMGARAERYYITPARVSKRFLLLSTRPPKVASLAQRVDLADRKTTNNDSYPFPILGKKPDMSNGYSFVTQPFANTTDVSGMSGVVHLVSNKRDLDVGLVLYQILPDGRIMQLSYYTGRASYAADMAHRHLLTPGREATIAFDRASIFSRRVMKGSRLLLTVNVNKNPFAQINYGTGKDVSTEDIRDAKVPLRVQWLTSTYINLAITR